MDETTPDEATRQAEREAEKAAMVAMDNFEDTVLKDVADHGDGNYSLTTEAGWGFGFTAPEGFTRTLSVGDKVRTFSKNNAVRGLDVEGEQVYFKSVRDLDEQHAQWKIDHERQQREKFEEERADLDARFESLPESFQKRLLLFRQENPDYRVKFESYEMFACTEAVVFAEELLKHFPLETTDWHAVAETMREDESLLKPVTSDEHSGNTYSFAKIMAFQHLLDMQEDKAWFDSLVYNMHGALVPLVGCEEYGCPHPRPLLFEGAAVLTAP